MNELGTKVTEAKKQMAELNAKISATQEPSELKKYNDQIQQIVAELQTFLSTSTVAQQNCIKNVLNTVNSVEIKKVCFNSTSSDISQSLAEVIKNYISQNDKNFANSQQMLEEL